MSKPDESLRQFRLPFLPDVEAIFGRHIRNEFRRHIHSTYLIGMVIQGRRIITSAGVSVTVSSDDVFVMNPGQSHACCSPDPAGHSYRILSVSPGLMQSIASHISEKEENPPHFAQIRYPSAVLGRDLAQLFDRFEKTESVIQVEIEIYSFIAALILDFAASPPSMHPIGEQKDAIKRVREYIHDHFTENLTLRQLAGIACLSPFHFQREFKKHMGITPHEYLGDYRIRQSKEMLLTQRNIADIAIQLGFFDQSHFSRAFKRTVGITPYKYIQLNK